MKDMLLQRWSGQTARTRRIALLIGCVLLILLVAMCRRSTGPASVTPDVAATNAPAPARTPGRADDTAPATLAEQLERSRKPR